MTWARSARDGVTQNASARSPARGTSPTSRPRSPGPPSGTERALLRAGRRRARATRMTPGEPSATARPARRDASTRRARRRSARPRAAAQGALPAARARPRGPGCSRRARRRWRGSAPGPLSGDRSAQATAPKPWRSTDTDTRRGRRASRARPRPGRSGAPRRRSPRCAARACPTAASVRPPASPAAAMDSWTPVQRDRRRSGATSAARASSGRSPAGPCAAPRSAAAPATPGTNVGE